LPENLVNGGECVNVQMKITIIGTYYWVLKRHGTP
jgi:hypothetical protein